MDGDAQPEWAGITGRVKQETNRMMAEAPSQDELLPLLSGQTEDRVAIYRLKFLLRHSNPRSQPPVANSHGR